MDGNNRWSKKNSKTKYESYKLGANKLISLSDYIFSNTDVNFISAFALSSNNLERSSNIIKIIKKILFEALVKYQNNKTNYNLIFIGDFDFLDAETKKKINSINKENFYKKKLVIYLNYGGKEDIQQAAKSSKFGRNFEKNLKSNKFPDPDILIRTGGFMRLSNFLLYQLAFTEIFFLKKLWPNLEIRDIKKIISDFSKIERKFGK